MRAAFKEWAVVVDALGRGDQIVILRKGGIAEEGGGFGLAHRSFALFPTRYHQQREGVIERVRHRYDEILARQPDESRVCLEYFATAEACLSIGSRLTIQRLRGCHVWRDEVIEERFGRGAGEGLFLMVVRVFRLRSAIDLSVRPSYGGCRSWVELEEDIDTSGAVPVLSDEAFFRDWIEVETVVGVQLAGSRGSGPKPADGAA